MRTRIRCSGPHGSATSREAFLAQMEWTLPNDISLGPSHVPHIVAVSTSWPRAPNPLAISDIMRGPPVGPLGNEHDAARMIRMKLHLKVWLVAGSLNHGSIDSQSWWTMINRCLRRTTSSRKHRCAQLRRSLGQSPNRARISRLPGSSALTFVVRTIKTCG